MSETKATAPVADPNAAANAKIADGILSRIHDNLSEIDRAFGEFDIAATDGPYPAALKAAKAFGLTTAEIAAWRPGSRKVVSDDPVENAIRTAHKTFKPDSAPDTRNDFSRVLRLVCHAAAPGVVEEARGDGPGQYRQKNLPQVSDKSRSEEPDLATPETALASLKKQVAKLGNAITFRVNPVEAVENPESIATLNKQLATMQVQGGLFQASLLLHFVADAFENACQDRGVAPATVWREAAQKAKAALAKAGKDATQNEILASMRDAAAKAVSDKFFNEAEVKAVMSQADLISGASRALFVAARKLVALRVLNQTQYDAISEVIQRHGVKDEVGDKLDEEEAKRVRKEAAQRLKDAEAETKRLAKEAADAATAKTAPVAQKSEGEEAAAAPTPKRSRVKFTPTPVATVEDTAEEDRNDALAELDVA
jgi:hypothetical protein